MPEELAFSFRGEGDRAQWAYWSVESGETTVISYSQDIFKKVLEEAEEPTQALWPRGSPSTPAAKSLGPNHP